MKFSDLKTQLKTPKRVVNQSLKRKQKIIEGKDTKITVLKSRLQGTELAQELAEAKTELLKLKKKTQKIAPDPL